MALSLLVRVAVFSSLLVAAHAGANPVEKVIKLLGDLKTEVETEGKAEGKSYEEFACFCKDTTKTKSTSITKGENKINTLSGDIADGTASKEEKEAEVTERKETHEKLGDDLSKTVARCSTQNAEFEAGDADMDKAILSLNKAIKSMNAKKGSMKLAQQNKKLDKDSKHALVLAQLDPSDPAYKYHSKEINEILAKCLTDFKDEKKDGEDKWKTTSAACTKTKSGLNKQMKDNLDAITKAEGKIEELAKKIAKDRGDLINSQESLEEDAAYLKDLTSQCENKAREFDQRASMRNDEITALAAALKIIGDKVKGADKTVNRDALLQSAPKAVSFLQTAPIKAVTSFLARNDLSTSERAIQEKVVSVLRLQGERLGSAELSTMAMRINAPDHMAKVKNMIQSLIERLLDEKKAEASKKGFCDDELAKGQNDRDKAQRQAMAMSVELKDLEAQKEELEAELKQLAKDIKEAEDEWDEADKLRQKEKGENKDTLKTANDGLEALNEAILILKTFYASAQFGRVSLMQGSPVDADTAGGALSGAYKGSEKKSRAIFDLLENIAGDFKSTIKDTEQAEAESHADFVKFDRKNKELIAGKETKTTLDKQDLKSGASDIDKTLDDLKSTMGLQADAIKMIASLKPACLDAGGMNFKERTEKRDEEIAALKFASCILDGKEEKECTKK